MFIARRRPAERVEPVLHSRPGNPRRAGRCAGRVALLGCALCAGAAWARSEPLPDGFGAGPIVLAPYFATNAGYENNLFRAPDCGPDDGSGCIGPQAEPFTRTSLGLAARMPVRNSLFDLHYQMDKREYQGYNPKRPREQTAGARFQFDFSSGDRLTVEDNHTLGASDVRIVDEGGEFVFRDAPFTYNRAEVSWQRFQQGHAGFAFRVTRVDLRFEPDPKVPFFDYSGWEGALEYRHPIPGRRWLRLYYDRRRFDHFEVGVDEASREPFRNERADTLQGGIIGIFGRGHPFDVRAGYGKFQPLGTGSEFRGLVGSANVSLRVGGRTRLIGAIWRRPLPSNNDTYYIVNSLRVSIERDLLRNIRAGLGLEHSRNQYLDPLPNDQSQEIRKDQRYVWEAYLDWFVHQRLAVRLAAARERRDSNFRSSEYDAAGAILGLRLGWF